MKRAIVILAVTLAGCGGTAPTQSQAYRVALHAARLFCAGVAALPEPAPVTSGGEVADP